MEKENDLIVEFNAKKEALKLFKMFLPYVNDEKDRIFEIMEIDTQKANAKQCALITLSEKMKTALKYKHCVGSKNDCVNLLSIKKELEKL